MGKSEDQNRREHTVSDIAEKLKVEREIITTSWYILKRHIGIEHKEETAPEVEKEWIQVVKECGNLYSTEGTPAQKILAKKISEAVIEYYRELSRSAERTENNDKR